MRKSEQMKRQTKQIRSETKDSKRKKAKSASDTLEWPGLSARTPINQQQIMDRQFRGKRKVGAHDGAYKGRLHSHVPFIGRKTLTMRQKTYNDVHGYYRARVEHLFAHLWSWRVVRDIWLGSHQDLHANTRILLHFSQFMLRRQKRYQPYGPWEHIPSSIWTEEEAPEVDEEEEDTFLCQVCGKRDTSECSTCDLYLCRGCMDEHLCDIDVPE